MCHLPGILIRGEEVIDDYLAQNISAITAGQSLFKKPARKENASAPGIEVTNKSFEYVRH